VPTVAGPKLFAGRGFSWLSCGERRFNDGLAQLFEKRVLADQLEWHFAGGCEMLQQRVRDHLVNLPGLPRFLRSVMLAPVVEWSLTNFNLPKIPHSPGLICT